MSNVLEKLQQRRRKEVELPSGLKVGYHLPDIQELIVKVGQLPLPALQELQAAHGEGVTEEQAMELVQTSPDSVAQGLRYVNLVVAAMLDDIDGEPVDTSDDREAIASSLEPEDRQDLFLIGTRQKDPDSGEA